MKYAECREEKLTTQKSKNIIESERRQNEAQNRQKNLKGFTFPSDYNSVDGATLSIRQAYDYCRRSAME